jgi:methyl-accepting chemotaxis protein
MNGQGYWRGSRFPVFFLIPAREYREILRRNEMNALIQLANIRIGKKLALILSSGIGSLLLIGFLCLWALSAIHSTTQQEQKESERLINAQRVGSDLGAVNAVVGHITLSQHCENCHGVTTGGDRSKQAGLALEGRSLMSELKAGDDTPQGIKLADDLEKNGDSWLDANLHVLELNKSGKSAESLAAYRDESIPNVGPFQDALQSYVNLCQSKYAQGKQRADLLARRMPIPIAACSLLAIAISTLLGLAVTRNIVKPLTAAVAHLDEVAGGEVSRDVSEEHLNRSDEIGNLGRGIQKMTVALRKMIQEIAGGIQVLSSSSTELMDTSTQMTSGSRQTSDKAHSVSSAAEQMSSNITSVAAGMEQTTTNLTHVASATEEMTTTIGEIAQKSERARQMTDEAVREAAGVTEQINQLGTAAREIGKVTETITEISSQTNLLALNATIEAARAGSSGKGFAVVAGEIKALAQQTAAATEDIKGRISGVQSATKGGVAKIEKISRVITEVSATVASIAVAIEQQSAATRDIARNISEASRGVTDANVRVAETSQVSREIAKDIASVDRAAGEMASGSDRVRISASELSKVAESLQITVARFHA